MNISKFDGSTLDASLVYVPITISLGSATTCLKFQVLLLGSHFRNQKNLCSLGFNNHFLWFLLLVETANFRWQSASPGWEGWLGGACGAHRFRGGGGVVRWAIDVLPLGWLIEGFTPKRKTIGSNRLALDDRWYTKHRVAPRLDLGTTLVTGQAIKIAEKIASFSVPAVQLAKDWVGDVCWILLGWWVLWVWFVYVQDYLGWWSQLSYVLNPCVHVKQGAPCKGVA